VKRKVGCGLWLVWLLLAVFAGEWLFLWLAFKVVPREQLPLYVFGVIVVTILGGWVAVYRRLQRRP
jgi:hypothetical protein